MLGSIDGILDTFKGIFDNFAGAGSTAFDKVFELATGSLGD
ncbi:hypothetical protein [Tomitella gaofuii]|nr:hypothetical protein [Tomitella gaofuii]